MTAADAKPLAVTGGEPAGIGPEIIIKAWAASRAKGAAFFVIGDMDALAAAPGGERMPFAKITEPGESATVFADALPVLHRPLPAPPTPGKPSPDAAKAVVGWIEEAVRLCLAGDAAALVTAPIAKAPLYAAGFGFPGHTELLGELTRDAPWPEPRGPVMMLAATGLRAIPVTIHEPLAAAPGLLSAERIVQAGQVTARALAEDFGIAEPRLAVAALNPHAGEGGALGREEIEIIAPACEALRALGVDCIGPKPADTLFHEEARRGYDAVLCMYHDQALIPLKMLDFWGGVNITLGLPVVRTSPDHGAGFDIAGKGVARPDSLIAALGMAQAIAARRAKARAKAV